MIRPDVCLCMFKVKDYLKGSELCMSIHQHGNDNENESLSATPLVKKIYEYLPNIAIVLYSQFKQGT